MNKILTSTSYTKFTFSYRQLSVYLMQGIFLSGAVSYLFYHSVIPFFISLPLLTIWLKEKKKQCIKKRKEALTYQFKDAILAFSNALTVGYSIENAFKEAYQDMKLIYKEEDDIMTELRGMIGQLNNNAVLETLLLDFAKRTDISDITAFAQVFSVAKRSGGDLNSIIRKTATVICEKIEVKREIQTALAGKQFEQKVMNVIPIAIVAYISLTSPHYFDSLYFNPAGVCIMSGCLFIYLAAFLAARKVMEIEVI